MPSVPAALTAAQYRRQLALRAQAIRDAQRLWSVYRIGDRSSWERMVDLAVPLVGTRHLQSSSLAAEYFTQAAAFATGRAERATLAGQLPEEQIRKSLAQTGLVGVVNARSKGFSSQAAMQIGFTRFQGGFSRLALMGGRATIVASVAGSRRARGWSRVTSDNPCEFCEGLAGESSTPDAFQAHDNCSCTAEPTFG